MCRHWLTCSVRLCCSYGCSTLQNLHLKLIKAVLAVLTNIHVKSSHKLHQRPFFIANSKMMHFSDSRKYFQTKQQKCSLLKSKWSRMFRKHYLLPPYSLLSPPFHLNLIKTNYCSINCLYEAVFAMNKSFLHLKYTSSQWGVSLAQVFPALVLNSVIYQICPFTKRRYNAIILWMSLFRYCIQKNSLIMFYMNVIATNEDECLKSAKEYNGFTQKRRSSGCGVMCFFKS